MSKPPPQDQPRVYNQANFSKTRQQRAAQISEEVRLLQRDQSSPTIRDSQRGERTFRFRNVDPEAVGRSNERPGALMGGRMGQSGAQGPEDDMVVADEEEYDEDEDEDDEDDEDEDEDEDEDDEDGGISATRELSLLEDYNKLEVTDVSFQPDKVSHRTFLELGQGGAVALRGNAIGVIEDRIGLIADATQDGVRVERDLRARVQKGHVVALKDEREVARVNFDRDGNSRKAQFAPLLQSTQDSIVDRLVRGKYTDPVTTTHRKSLLNRVAMNMTLNGTYLAADSSRFLRKVGSLLPAETTARSTPRRVQK